MCRKQKNISTVKNEEQSFTLQKSVESFTAQQKVLLHSRKLYYAAKSFTAQQKALLHSRKFYCTVEGLLRSRKFYCATEDFIAQYKALPHSKKVSLMAEIGEKLLLRQKQRISPLCSIFPWTWTQCLRTNWQRQNGTLEFIPRSARPNFLLRKKPRLSVVQ